MCLLLELYLFWDGESNLNSQIPDTWPAMQEEHSWKFQMWSPCTMPREEFAEQYQDIDVTVLICIATLELAELQSRRRAT